MTYKEIFGVAKEINQGQVMTLSTSYEYLFLRISFFVTPLFILFGVTANTVTLIMLLTGIGAAVSVACGSAGSVALGIFLFLSAQVLDATDGSVARMTDSSTFYGRFLDGVVDIVILCAMQLALAVVLFAHSDQRLFIGVSIAAVVLGPFHHFYFDRYSAYVRWINEEHGMHLQPYLKRTLSPRLNWLLNDTQYTCLIAVAVLFSPQTTAWQYVLFVYYVIHIMKGVYYIAVHTLQANKVMRVGARQK